MLKSASTCALLATAALLFSTGCDKKVISTMGLPSIIGTVSVDSGPGDRTISAYVGVDGTRLLPVTAINKETLELSDYSTPGEYGWSSSWRGSDLHLSPGDPCVLHVFQSNGEAHTDTEVVPNLPRITTPETSFSLREDQSLDVAWVGTPGVDRYQIEFRIDYDYHRYNTFSLDTTITLPAGSTSYTLPGSVIFPAYVDSLEFGYCYITVTAEAGPDVGHECDGNVKGNGCGYFFAVSTAGSRCLIGSPDAIACPKPPAPTSQTARQFVERKRALIADQ